MKESTAAWKASDNEIPFKEVVDTLLISQYMETLGRVGGNELILRGEPGEVLAIQEGLPKSYKVDDLLS